jgi:hypothetical protein
MFCTYTRARAPDFRIVGARIAEYRRWPAKSPHVDGVSSRTPQERGDQEWPWRKFTAVAVPNPAPT